MQRHTAPLASEGEANDTTAGATPLLGTNGTVTGDLYPEGDVDVYALSGHAGDRVFATAMIGTSAGSDDTVLTLLGGDGVTVLASDDDTFGSSLSGVTLPATGPFYLALRAKELRGVVLPYHLHYAIWPQTARPLPPHPTPDDLPPIGPGLYAGVIQPSLYDRVEVFTLTLAAGDTVFLGIDPDPLRNGQSLNIEVGMVHGGAPVVLGQDFFVTVREAGTYGVLVRGRPFGTDDKPYLLSIALEHAPPPPAGCRTYSSAGPVAIDDATTSTSTITIPDRRRIGDLDVHVQLNHADPNDLQLVLTAPGGNRLGLARQLGEGYPSSWNVDFDDEASTPPYITDLTWQRVQPQGEFRLDWLDGTEARGDWTLTLTDTFDGGVGTLASWSMTICEAPPDCPEGYTEETISSADFEADDGGFQHDGSGDAWAHGTPQRPPIVGCASGHGCWKTGLAGTYVNDATMDLISPPIDLSTEPPGSDLRVRWTQNHQLRSAVVDHAEVSAEAVDGDARASLWQWRGGNMVDLLFVPEHELHESTGWSVHIGDLGRFAGQRAQLRFHLDSHPSNIGGPLAGWAVDDVVVYRCVPPPMPDAGLADATVVDAETPDATTRSDATPSDATPLPDATPLADAAPPPDATPLADAAPAAFEDDSSGCRTAPGRAVADGAWPMGLAVLGLTVVLCRARRRFLRDRS